MQRLIDSFFHLLEVLVVVCLVAMVFMVLGNVVLRYAFNSGIAVSEEMSRYCFIWLTFIGAMVAMREGGHLGVDTLVRHLGVGGKKLCLFLSESLMLFCNALFLIGTWRMHELQVTAFFMKWAGWPTPAKTGLLRSNHAPSPKLKEARSVGRQ